MRTWKKSRSGIEAIPVFSRNDCEHCFDLPGLFYIADVHLEWRKNPPGLYAWTIYLVPCGFGYAGYVFYLAATGA